jgi:hypothetical protein
MPEGQYGELDFPEAVNSQRSRVGVSYRNPAGRQSRPAGCSFASFIGGRLALGFGKDREAVRDEVNRVTGLAFNFVARLADAPSDADKIADCGFGEPVA